jgi:hypothetical protein
VLVIDEPVDENEEERSTVTHTDLICSESRLVQAPITCTQHLLFCYPSQLVL